MGFYGPFIIYLFHALSEFFAMIVFEGLLWCGVQMCDFIYIFDKKWFCIFT